MPVHRAATWVNEGSIGPAGQIMGVRVLGANYLSAAAPHREPSAAAGYLEPSLINLSI